MYDVWYNLGMDWSLNNLYFWRQTPQNKAELRTETKQGDNSNIYPIHKQVLTHLPSIWLNFQQPPPKKNLIFTFIPLDLFPVQLRKIQGFRLHQCILVIHRIGAPGIRIVRSHSFQRFSKAGTKKKMESSVFLNSFWHVFFMIFSCESFQKNTKTTWSFSETKKQKNAPRYTFCMFNSHQASVWLWCPSDAGP